MSLFNDRPRADELEKLVSQYPNLHKVDWDAEPVDSGINCDLWRAWHARHYSKCSPTQVHDDCYLKLIYHFLRTGFEPPEEPHPLMSKNRRHRAYVNKWNKEQKRCKIAFDKWVRESEGLMSPQTDRIPSFFSPLLLVVREKDKWRYKWTGIDYKVRLCLDLKCSKYNKQLLD